MSLCSKLKMLFLILFEVELYQAANSEGVIELNYIYPPGSNENQYITQK